MLSCIVALDGNDGGQLFCFRENPAGLRQLKSKRQQVTDVVEQSTSSAAADGDDLELDMSVEDEDEQLLIDSEDDDEEDSNN